MEIENLLRIKELGEYGPTELNKIYKLELINRFMVAKVNNPHLKQDQLCKLVGTSASTIKRIRADLNIGSFYRYDVPLKSKKKKEKEPEKERKPKKKKSEKLGYGPEPEEITDFKEKLEVVGLEELEENFKNPGYTPEEEKKKLLKKKLRKKPPETVDNLAIDINNS